MQAVVVVVHTELVVAPLAPAVLVAVEQVQQIALQQHPQPQIVVVVVVAVGLTSLAVRVVLAVQAQ